MTLTTRQDRFLKYDVDAINIIEPVNQLQVCNAFPDVSGRHVRLQMTKKYTSRVIGRCLISPVHYLRAIPSLQTYLICAFIVFNIDKVKIENIQFAY